MKRLFINPAMTLTLSRVGLLTFDDFWRLRARPFKRKRDREIRVLNLDGKTYYLKRYFRLPRWRKSGAETEWEGAMRLLRAGFSVPLPVCLGLERTFWAGRAFTLFRSAQGVRLEDLFRQQFWPPLVTPLAEVAGRFHAQGFSHQDFYLCHFFWDEEEGRLTIIDLQRLRWAKRPKKRWVVKDLAELFYSVRETLSQDEAISFQEEFLRTYASYLPWVKEKGFWSRVEKKIKRIARHDQKLKARTLD